MRGKCETCEFFKKLFDGRDRGTCHIRSVASDSWPVRQKGDVCGEHQPQSMQLDPPEDLPEVHAGTRVEKSMEPFYPLPERVKEPS